MIPIDEASHRKRGLLQEHEIHAQISFYFVTMMIHTYIHTHTHETKVLERRRWGACATFWLTSYWIAVHVLSGISLHFGRFMRLGAQRGASRYGLGILSILFLLPTRRIRVSSRCNIAQDR